MLLVEGDKNPKKKAVIPISKLKLVIKIRN